MKVAIMQPYFMPYLGYFSLIDSSDVFIFYDDVNYINKGYINRNSICMNGSLHNFTLPLSGASQNKLINQISLGENRTKILKTIKQSYAKAKFYEDFAPVVDDIFSFNDDNLARFVSNSIVKISQHLGFETEFLYSSDLCKDASLRGQDKIININRVVGADLYINPIGGQSLYDKSSFLAAGLELKFLVWKPIPYFQAAESFLANLSVIDAIFNTGRDHTRNLISSYELI